MSIREEYLYLTNSGKDNKEAIERLAEIIALLRHECPWDKVQTHETLRKGMIEEAYEVGYEALKQASLGKCGYMIGIKRESNSPYKSSYFLIEADKVANNVKYFPTEWINEEGNNIKPEALEYLTPLISSVPSVISSVAMPSFKVFNKQFN